MFQGVIQILIRMMVMTSVPLSDKRFTMGEVIHSSLIHSGTARQRGVRAGIACLHGLHILSGRPQSDLLNKSCNEILAKVLGNLPSSMCCTKMVEVCSLTYETELFG